MILEPGNLLCMARLTFRVKCYNQFREIRSPGMLSTFRKVDIFYGIKFYGMKSPVHKNYT